MRHSIILALLILTLAGEALSQGPGRRASMNESRTPLLDTTICYEKYVEQGQMYGKGAAVQSGRG